MYVRSLPPSWRRLLSVRAGFDSLEMAYWRLACRRLPRTYKNRAPANDNG